MLKRAEGFQSRSGRVYNNRKEAAIDGLIDFFVTKAKDMLKEGKLPLAELDRFLHNSSGFYHLLDSHPQVVEEALQQYLDDMAEPLPKMAAENKEEPNG